MSENFDIVIIGNSAAGLSAAKKIRQLDGSVSVALIDREDCPAYSRVMTPYYVGRKIDKNGLFLVSSSFYEDNGITPIFGSAVVELNPEMKTVLLENGKQISYGKLLMATGAEATKINMSAKASSVLRHLDDADVLEERTATATSVTAIGAGLVSLPVLSHLKNDVEKNLIVGSNRIFSRVVNPEAAEIIEKRFIEKGVNIYKNDDVQSHTETDRLRLELKSGKTIETDLLVVGKGVQPNVSLPKNAGLKVNDGILIDDFCKTSIEDIYAAGDVAEGKDFITGEMLIQGNWMTAVEQGEVAALNMLGITSAYEGSLKNNITDVFDTEVAVVGYYYDDAPNAEVYYNAETGLYRKVFLDKDDRVIGATMIGDTNDAGLYYRMVSSREKFPGRHLLNRDNRYTAVLNRLA